MPQNKELAVQQAMYVKRKFKRDARCQQQYQDFMKGLIENNYAKGVRGVYHPEKPNKIRVLFDAFAKFQGISQNQALLPGTDLTNYLISVLLCLRR